MKDWTREILIQKYGDHKSVQAQETLEAVPDREQQAQYVYKAAGAFPAINEYQCVSDWLKVVAAATLGWPDDLRSSVVADEIKKHLLSSNL